MALCWIGFVMVFFTFSTTQEYYSMPIYPAMALLVGSAITLEDRVVRAGTRAVTVFCAIAAILILSTLVAVRHLPTPGDISQALSSNPSAYKLSLGHMEDLTLNSFAYLRLPLAVAAAAFVIGGISTIRAGRKTAYLGIAIMMLVFFHAARLAMVTFDPYLSSRPLINALERSPRGELIIDHHYYWFSSVFFYTDRTALLLNGRFFNLIYGSYAPTSANPFIDDNQFRDLWGKPDRYYIFAKNEQLDQLASVVGRDQLITVSASGGKVLLTNRPLSPR
jgi:4-amino-4-deoxy-L-arabinose transferase-like glycosyltransferase